MVGTAIQHYNISKSEVKQGVSPPMISSFNKMQGKREKKTQFKKF